MKSKKKVVSTILMLILFFNPYHISSSFEDDFRAISFEDKGYLLNYEIIQGENLNEMFENLGFDIDGSFTGSQFNILVKNRLSEIRDIYFIESDKIEQIEVPVYSYENYVELSGSLTASIDMGGEFLTDLIGFNYHPVEPKVLEAELPETSTIYLPNIFTNITRPNFGSLMTNLDYFDFLPFIIGNDFNRYEAEFSSLILNESFTVNVYNQDYEEFTISLDIDLETPLKMKATWDKHSGLLLSLSLHFIYDERSSVFIIALNNYEEIQTPITQPDKTFFITNSSANYEVFTEDVGTELRLEEWKTWFDQLNQTFGLRYSFAHEGLNFDEYLMVYNQEDEMYYPSTPIHDSWISFLPPAVIPIWDSYIGAVNLIESIWTQLEEEINNFEFILSGVTSTLYSFQDADLHLEYQFNDGLHQLLWYGALHYISNNTRKVVPSYAVTEISFETDGWLAYSQEGLLEGFSFYFSEFYNSYLQNITDFSITETYDNYYYDYFLESKPENITEPYFTETNETAINVSILQIVFYSIVAYSYLRKNRKKREKNEYF
ncbi:MAG: hypothetical protein GOP50_06740 [Candidatus Heimdallarchaeota archaeon]|nr:hypothetical protein [Candidatus Heimdallarchaeota archaeon]